MANRFVLTHIRNLPLLSRIPPQQLEWLAEAVEIIQLQPGQLVFRQGQPGQGLYLLVNGRAVLFTGEGATERVLGEVRENQYVGEASLFRAATERMSMRVTQPSLLLLLPRAKFQQALLEHPELRAYMTSQQSAPDSKVPPAFPGQRPGEHLLLREQRHKWAFIRHSFLPLLIGAVLFAIGLTVANTGLPLVFLILAFIVPGAWIYYAYIEWQNDFVIITDQRIIHHTRTIVSLQNEIREILISSVHEVSYNIPPADVFARLFHYGTVFIKTAGESGNMELTLMPNPEQIQRVLITDLQNYRKVADQQNREAIGQVIDQFLMPDSANTSPNAQQQQNKPPVKAQDPGLLATRFVDEQGAITYRKHISVWLAHVLLPSLFILAGGALFLAGLILPDSPGAIGILLGPFVSLLGIVWFYWADWDWRHDMLILGESTIRIVHQRPLWLEDISEQLILAQVDDAAVNRNGLLNTILNRGDLSISLIGDDTAKQFHGLGSPEIVKNEIFERRNALKRKEQEAEVLRQRQEIARYLDVYHERMQAMTPNYPASPQNFSPPPYNPVQPPYNPNPPAAGHQNPPQPPPSGRQGPRPPRVPRARGDQNSQ